MQRDCAKDRGPVLVIESTIKTMSLLHFYSFCTKAVMNYPFQHSMVFNMHAVLDFPALHSLPGYTFPDALDTR